MLFLSKLHIGHTADKCRADRKGNSTRDILIMHTACNRLRSWRALLAVGTCDRERTEMSYRDFLRRHTMGMSYKKLKIYESSTVDPMKFGGSGTF